LEIFEQTPITREPTIKIVTMEMLIFKRYQINSKEIKWPLQWFVKHEAMFPIIVVWAQTLRIVGSQIEIERIFLIIGILTNLKTCHLQ
jgi:hypothetical protein